MKSQCGIRGETAGATMENFHKSIVRAYTARTMPWPNSEIRVPVVVDITSHDQSGACEDVAKTEVPVVVGQIARIDSIPDIVPRIENATLTIPAHNV